MYIGRFAPTPSGPLHFGSLLAAMTSYLEARSRQGKWLLRIEDLDKPREVSGAAERIIRALAGYGFQWDGKIEYQSNRIKAYQQALAELSAYTYPCTCSRQKIRANAKPGTLGLIYPGHCRHSEQAPENKQYAIRIRTPDEQICFDDAVQGRFCQNLALESGDFIIRRADKLFAYQLAVVVDDQWQGITHVVRGADLLDNTQRQMHLQHCLNYPTPAYMHIPLASYADGQKLSKHTHAPAIAINDTREIVGNLCEALAFLGQPVPAPTDFNHIEDCWEWAIQYWNNDLIPRKMSIPYLK